jgi:asparagine synthase (glutamine-hydrolysing)
MIRIELQVEGWAQSGETRARGYAHLGDRFLEAQELAATLDGCTTNEIWLTTVSRLNGCFAAVTARGDRVLAAADRIRSMPLFYALDGDDDICLSDSAYRVMGATHPCAMDALAESEFCLTGYVTGRETLLARVFQVEAGEAVCFDHSATRAPERHRYHEFHHGDYFAATSADLISRLEEVHSRVFRRLVQTLGGRTIVVPLSGGYDSRLIGISLRDLGVRDVVCYSYGVPGNWESRISRELATYLGFRWEFVPYSPERWRAWAATKHFDEYFLAAGNLTSVPHIQDWPAVNELQRESRIPPDSIFVPGHSGDFLAGSHIPKGYAGRSTITRREILDSLQAAHYSLWDWPSAGRRELRDRIDQRIEAIVGAIGDGPPEQAADTFERWDLRERQAKFICNSMRVYEYFGCEWRLPLFDHELMDFWARVPFELRLGRKLYLEFAARCQALPVTAANADHGSFARTLIRAIDSAGLRPFAKRAQHAVRKVRWRHSYSNSPLAWPALIDRDQFRRTYTGKELLHSYLAPKYRDEVVRVVSQSLRENRRHQFIAS